MNDIIVYVGTGFNATETASILTVLRMHSIMVTTDKACATFIIEPAKDIEVQLKELIPMEKEFLIPPHIDMIIPNPESKPNKKTFIRNNVTKQYKNIKQIYRQRFLTRTRCK